jgi:hypothetical protein
MNVSGNYSSIRRLLDVVYDDNNVRITTFSFTPNPDEAGTERFPLNFLVTLLAS